MSESTIDDGFSATEDAKIIHHGDFVTLYVEGPDAGGYAAVGSFSDENVTVFTGGETPPNFERSCVFQVVLLNTDAELGSVIKYGSNVALMHRLTSKLIRLDPRNLGIKDGHRISLHPTQGAIFGPGSSLPPEQAWLKPMPRIKLFSEGERIKFNSPILFECTKNSGKDAGSGGAKLRLHLPPSETVICGSQTKATSIRLRLFANYAQSQSDSQNALKGGDFIRLFHQEHEAFIEVARHADNQPSHTRTASGAADFISSETTLCLRLLPEGVEPETTHSASSLWQIELQDTRSGGRPVNWSEPLRLKNMISDGYLDVSQKTKVGALGVSTVVTPGCVLFFEPPPGAMEDGRASIRLTDPVYIKAAGGVWFHAGESVVEEADDDEDENTSSFIQPKFVSSMRDEDALNLHIVDLIDIQELSRAKECFSTVQDMIQCDVTLLKEDSAEFKRFAQDLDALIMFCTADDEDIPADHYDGQPLHYHQNILSDLRIEDALMDFVSLPFKKGSQNNAWATGTKQPWAQILPGMLGYNKLVRKSFRVMRQMCKGNLHNSYVTAMKFKIPMTNSCKLASKLAFQNGYEWDIPSTLEMMFRDNSALLKDIDPSYIEKYVALVREADRPHELEQYFDLLASFCVHDGIAIEPLQNEIFKHTKDLVPKTLPVKFLNGVAQKVKVEHRVFANNPGVHYADWQIVEVPLESYTHPKFLYGR